MSIASELKILLTAENRASGPMDVVRGSLNQLRESSGSLVENGLSPLRDMLSTGLKVAAAGAATAIGGIVSLGGKGIQLAAGFEQTETAFTTMLGSADKAKDMMKDLSSFAASTPFQFDEVSKAGKQLVAFNVDANDVKGVLRQLGDVASGVGIPMADMASIYGKVKSAGKVTGETLMQLGERGVPIIHELAKVFGVADDQVADLVSHSKVGFPEFQKALSGMTDVGGKFAGLMDKQSKTVNGLWSSLKDNVELALAGIGKSLTDNLNIREVMSAAIDWTGNWGATLKTMADTWLPAIITKVKEVAADWMPPLIQAFNDWWAIGRDLVAQIPTLLGYVSTFAGYVKDAIQPVIDWVAKNITLNDVLLGLAGIVGVIAVQALAAFVIAWAPVAAVIAGAILIASALRHAWEDDWGGVRTIITNTANAISNNFMAIKNVLRDFGMEAIAEITGWGEDIHPGLSAVSTIIFWAFRGVPDLFGGMLNWITGHLPGWIAVLADWGLAAARWIIDATVVIVTKLAAWGGTVLGWVADHLPAWATTLLAWGTVAWSWIADATVVIVTKLTEWGGVLLGWVTTNLPTWTAKLGEWASALWGWISPTVISATTQLGIWASTLGGWMAANLPIWLATLSGWASALWDWISPMIGPATTKLGEWATALYGWISTNLTNWLVQITPWGLALFQWIGDAVPKALDALTAWVDGLLGWGGSKGTSKVQELLNLLGTAMLDALGKIGIALGKLALTVAGDLMLSLAKGLLDWAGIDVNWADLHDHMIAILGTLADTLRSHAGLIGGIIALALVPGLAALATTILGSVIPAIGSLVFALGGAILSAVGSLATIFTGLLMPALTMIASWITTVAIPAIIALAAPFTPIILIVGAVVAVIAGLYVAWNSNFLGIRDKTTEVFNYIKGVFTDFPGTIEGLKTAFATWGSAALTKVREGFDSVKDFVRNGLEVAIDWIAAGREGKLGPFQQAMFDAGSGFLNKLGAGINAVKLAVGTTFSTALNEVQQKGIGFATGELLGKMYEGGKSFLGKISEGINVAAPNLKTDMSNAIGALPGIFDPFVTGFKAHVLGGGKDIINNIVNGLKGVDLAGQADAAFYKVAEVFNKIMDGFKTHVGSVMETVGGNLMTGLVNGITKGVGAVMTAIGGVTDALPQWVKDKLGIHSPSTVFAGFGKNIMAGLTQGIQSMADHPQLALDSVATSLTAQLGGLQLGSNTRSSNVTNNNQRINNFNLSPASGGSSSGNQNQQMLELLRTLTAVYAN